MLRTRVIPCLLLRNGALVKSVRFRNPQYVGDPVNTVRIYNDKEVDEIIILDITATPQARPPQFDLIAEIAGECFMPVTYGGGITSLDEMTRLFGLGVEKVALNARAVTEPELIRAAVGRFGSQSIVVSIDVKRKLFGRYEVYTHNGTKSTGVDPVSHAVQMAEMGAGELLVTSIDRDGMMSGYDIELIKRIEQNVAVPIVACGGAGSLEHFNEVVRVGGASAVAAGSLVVYQGPNRAVLINFPSRDELETVFSESAKQSEQDSTESRRAA